MTWARLKLVNLHGAKAPGRQQAERVFNLSLVQWWVGHGAYCELQFSGQPPVYVEIEDKRLEKLTGTSGGYSNE